MSNSKSYMVIDIHFFGGVQVFVCQMSKTCKINLSNNKLVSNQLQKLHMGYILLQGFYVGRMRSTNVYNISLSLVSVR